MSSGAPPSTIGSRVAAEIAEKIERLSPRLLEYQMDRLADALDRIEAQFQPDVMIFDLPPTQVSDDTMAALGHL